jgi:hypothetical protein
MVSLLKKVFFKIFNRVFQLFFGVPYSMYIGALSTRSFDSMSSVLIWMISGLEKKHPNFKIKGKEVVELGSGAFFSHPLGLKLLGANKISSFDLYRQFNKRAAAISFSQRLMSKKFFTSKIDSSFYNTTLDQIIETNHDLKKLEKIGIHYFAPYDINNSKTDNQFDLFISYTVLEHVPPRDISNLLKTSIKIIKPLGYFCHFIDLEDHKNSKEHPFDFLKFKNWSDEDCFNRGNRLRLNEWKEEFDSIDNIDYEFINILERDKNKLPPGFKKEINNYASGILVVGQKKV